MATKSSRLQAVRKAIQKSGANWIANENSISTLPLKQRRMRLGLNIPISRPAAYPLWQPPGPIPLPGYLDWRDRNSFNYVTPVRDQGSCGACVAFGTVATIESQYSIVNQTNNPMLDLSEAQLFSCYGAKCATGWDPALALPYCINPGLVPESCFPYKPMDQPCNLCPGWQTQLTKIASFQSLPGYLMKGWLFLNGPVTACLHIYEDFFYYTSGVYKHVCVSRRSLCFRNWLQWRLLDVQK
jgi:hypothetical protein